MLKLTKHNEVQNVVVAFDPATPGTPFLPESPGPPGSPWQATTAEQTGRQVETQGEEALIKIHKKFIN